MHNQRCFLTLLCVLWLGVLSYAQPSTTTAPKPTDKKMKFLIHITCGPDNPTKAALGFLIAKTALDEGHTVALFLAGDGVTLLKDAELNKVVGLGTGKLRDHYEAIAKAGGKFYLSGMSSKARNVTDADITGKPAEFALPTVLVRLAADSDRMFTY